MLHFWLELVYFGPSLGPRGPAPLSAHARIAAPQPIFDSLSPTPRMVASLWHPDLLGVNQGASRTQEGKDDSVQNYLGTQAMLLTHVKPRRLNALRSHLIIGSHGTQ